MNDIRLNLPANWNQLYRGQRINLIAEIVPCNFESLPCAERGRIESTLAYAALQLVDPKAAQAQLLREAERVRGIVVQ